MKKETLRIGHKDFQVSPTVTSAANRFSKRWAPQLEFLAPFLLLFALITLIGTMLIGSFLTKETSASTFTIDWNKRSSDVVKRGGGK